MNHKAHALVEEVRHRRLVLAKPKLRRLRRLPSQLPPRGVTLAYARAIRALLDQARAVVEARVLPRLPAILAAARAERGDRMDASGDDVTSMMSEVRRELAGSITATTAERMAAKYAERTKDWSAKEIAKQTHAAFGVDVLAAEPKLAGKVGHFVAENVALITSVPARYLEKVEGAVTRGVTAGRRPSAIARELVEQHDIASDRATLIARDQVGKLYGAINLSRQTALGVTRYIWRTVGDERVRDEHSERDGQTFSWDDPPEDGHPGEPINCRCFADPVLDDLLDGL